MSRIQLIRGLAGTTTTADLSDNDSGTVAQVSFTVGRGVTVVTNTMCERPVGCKQVLQDIG
jgi:hypothetical protein